MSIIPVAILFLIWDAYAVANGHWKFDPEQVLGIYGPFEIPLDKITFFDSSAGLSTINLSDTFGAPSYTYPTPLMNLNLQNTYAFEVITTTADTAQLSKIIPN